MANISKININSIEYEIKDDVARNQIGDLSSLKTSDKDSLVAAINEAAQSGTLMSTVEPAEDDIPKVFFGGALQQTKDEAVVSFRYISKTEDISGYAEIKAQGNSSMSYPKKNQTVKLYKDAECTEKLKVDFKGWGKQNKFCFKANWIDLIHARNVVSARLWADVVKSRSNYEELPELLRTSPNQGAVDGFPIKVYADGVYQGRYTMNIPKDKWMSNMDDDLDNHCILCGENYASGCFRATANINGSDWTDEIHDTVPTSIKTRWNEVISFVMNSTDEEFKANLGNYFYVDSLIDYHLFGLASCGLDAYGKNQLYMTYDGQKWAACMYDMDSSWGLYWNGSSFVAFDYARTSYEDWKNAGGNLLYIRLERLFYEEIQSRWAELKVGALSIENIINRFERFTDIAPLDLVKEDYASTTGGGKFTGIPSQSTNNIQQIRSFALARQTWTDEYVTALSGEGGEVEPDEPDEPIVPDEPDVPDINETLYENYSPNGESFAKTIDIDFDEGDYIEAEIDVTNCTANSYETIFSIGSDVSLWRTGGLHLCYKNSIKELQINYVSSNDSNPARKSITLTNNIFKVKQDKNGVTVNGVLIEATEYTTTSTTAPTVLYNAIMNVLVAMSTVQVGSKEGSVRSHATYNYIKVVRGIRPCTGIALSQSALTFTEVGSQTLTATVMPEGCTDTVTWESSDTTIVTVSGGVVTAVSSGDAAITAKCGNYSATCAISVNISDILYSLPEETVFDGTNYIDTGVKLFDRNKDFTVFIEFTPSGSNSQQATVFSSMYEASPYAGFTIRNRADYEVQVTNNNMGIGNKESEQVRTKVCVTYKNGSATIDGWYAYTSVFINTTINMTTGNFNQSVLLGCHQQTDGARIRYWSGVVHNCEIYNRILSNEEIYSKLGVEIDTYNTLDGIVWSDTPTYSINSGEVVSGKSNYVTVNAIEIPEDLYEGMAFYNRSTAKYTYLGVAQYKEDMTFISYKEADTTHTFIPDATAKYIRLSAYPNNGNDPSNQLTLTYKRIIN